jgi:hypothetical protein
MYLGETDNLILFFYSVCAVNRNPVVYLYNR